MDAGGWSQIVPSLLLAVALAACAGLRAWLPLFLAGLLMRLGMLKLSASYAFLGDTRALLLFGVATLIEIVADKFPAVDHALDAVSTVVRPVAGSLLAAAALGWVKDPLVALAFGVLVGAPTALVPHGAKAGVRALSSTFTFGLANPVLSFIEDVATIILFILAVLVPLVVVLFLVAGAVFVLRRLAAHRPDTPRPASIARN